ncbi:glutamate/gamma-aminobutyrate family transporter YjeM [Lentilactobacillus kribbianus]|uniref:glutamate/gamma-aminobutyrate family transporter YjeM n=1 Tax=Lentilactobacillus kribbianus TaxID=2729622 RepID=UPI00155290CB|nr:glutamate/gamma-aminobutyrate family transporter YjeM [Lentilactobacillus kribbianus]
MTTKSKISLVGLILMIFSSIYGFANTPIAFAQMGYASIIWYIFAAIIFFLPAGLMFAEYGSAFKDEHGGFYSWLSNSVGEKFAFIGTFIWLSSWIIWMVSTSSKIWVPLTTMFAGSDQTQTWHLFGLAPLQTVGVLAIAWMILVTFSTAKGVDSIARVGSVGGTFVMILTGIFFIASIVIVIANHGQLAQPINGMSSFIKSPNPDFQSPIALLSFVVYAIFAYAGMESLSGIVDDLDKPEKTFPKGIMVATFFITIFYSLSIFLWGISANWMKNIGASHVTLGNITYVLMNNLGITFGNSIGLSHSTSLLIGSLLSRFTGLAMFLAYCGSFFIMTYSPLKSFIMGSPKELWPKRMTKLNKNGMPGFAMWIQAAVICVIIVLISFGGSEAQKFYQILTNMGNISTSVPYLFLIGAFPAFKKKKDLDRPFVAYRNPVFTNFVVGFILLVISLGIIFTIAQPILSHNYMSAFWTTIGPIFFGGVALIFYEVQTRKQNRNK